MLKQTLLKSVYCFAFLFSTNSWYGRLIKTYRGRTEPERAHFKCSDAHSKSLKGYGDLEKIRNHYFSLHDSVGLVYLSPLTVCRKILKVAKSQRDFRPIFIKKCTKSLYIFCFQLSWWAKFRIRYEIYPPLLYLGGKCDNRVDFSDELYISSEEEIRMFLLISNLLRTFHIRNIYKNNQYVHIVIFLTFR